MQNVPDARTGRVKWEPDGKAWEVYVKTKERYGELDRASVIYNGTTAQGVRACKRDLQIHFGSHPSASSLIRFRGQLLEDYIDLETDSLEFGRWPLSMPEFLWKTYIEKTEKGEQETAQLLYERLISLGGHVKLVWISYVSALLEAESNPVPRAMQEEDEDEDAVPKMVIDRAYTRLESKRLKDVRVALLLEVWKTFGETHGLADGVTNVISTMPIIAEKRHVDQEIGQVVEDQELVSAGSEGNNNPKCFY
ncbi:hypothetical protein C8R42DRAFT_726424 [Lentinula raphanica]|nr:hypothetical protein C8R42DRAFT_726424 [Lentinula raphanica]